LRFCAFLCISKTQNLTNPPPQSPLPFRCATRICDPALRWRGCITDANHTLYPHFPSAALHGSATLRFAGGGEIQAGRTPATPVRSSHLGKVGAWHAKPVIANEAKQSPSVCCAEIAAVAYHLLPTAYHLSHMPMFVMSG